MNGHGSHAADVGTQVIGNCLKRTLLDTGGRIPSSPSDTGSRLFVYAAHDQASF